MGTTGPTPGPLPGPNPAPTTHSNGVKFNTPDIFDGSFRNFRKFQRDLDIFLTGYGVADDEKKIMVALSYMRGTHAEEFVQETYNNYVRAGNWGTYDAFKDRMKERFQSKNLVQEAREKLEKFVQDKMLVDEYFTRLDMIFADAEVTEDSEKIRIIERGINHQILEVIYSDAAGIPTAYADYKTKCLKIGRMKERLRNLQRIHAIPHHPPATHTPPKTTPQFHTHIHAPTPEKKTATGVTYGGAGLPMDLSQTRQPMRCFNCGELGHMRRDCPKEKAKLNVRAMMSQFEEGEIDELRKELDSSEWDFTDGR